MLCRSSFLRAPTLAFIGAGNMGKAIASGAIMPDAVGRERKVRFDEHQLFFASRTPERRAYIAERFPAAGVFGDGADMLKAATAAAGADDPVVTVVAVKPYQVQQVAKILRPHIDPQRHIIVSVIAALTIADLTKLFADDLSAPKRDRMRIVRTMPNTPLKEGCGTTVYTPNLPCTPRDTALVEAAFSGGDSICERIEERIFDACAGLNGCGPAFTALFAEGLTDGAVRCGVPRELAQRLAMNTVKGAAHTIAESGKNPGAFKDEVCTPGGITIAGVTAAEQAGLRFAAIEAVSAAYSKAHAVKAQVGAK